MECRRVGIFSVILLFALCLAAGNLRPVITYANGATPFSGYGEGTEESPYRIATCAQLQSMNDHLDATYELVSNIDCDGVDFTNIGIYSLSDFTGNLYGNNHTIKNLTINGLALFQSVVGSTIKDLRIESGSVNSPNTAASIVGVTGGATVISNVHSSMNISADGGYTGGLVAIVDGDSSSFEMTQSSFSGTVSAPEGYVGGLISAVFIDDVVIEDSFVDGIINTAVSYTGAAIGALFSGGVQVHRIYSSATMNFDGTQLYSGGLVGGFFGGTVTDSFSASLANGIGGVGGLWGSGDNGVSTNNWFDLYRIGTGNCVYDGSNTCSGATNSQAAPEVWRGDNQTTPLDSWDFDTIWQAQDNEYPTLRGLQTILETNIVPNNGDANGDGIEDSYQAHVKSLSNDAGVWSTIETSADSNCTIENTQWSNPYSTQTDTGFAPQLTTTTGFDVYCPTAGATVSITVIYDTVYDTSKSVLRYYNPTTKSFQTVSGAVFGTRTIGGVTKTTVTYSITDGGSLDSDGSANKIIKDPIMLSRITVGAPDTGIRTQTSSHNLPLVLITLILGTLGFYGVSRKKQQ